MKWLFLLLLLAGFTAAAQQVDSSPRPPMTQADSAQLIRDVFKRERRQGRLGVGLGSLLTGVSVGSLTTQDWSSRSGLSKASSLYFPAFGTYSCIQGIVRWRRFSQKREEAAVARFLHRQAQPGYVQRRLLAVYYARALWLLDSSAR